MTYHARLIHKAFFALSMGVCFWIAFEAFWWRFGGEISKAWF